MQHDILLYINVRRVDCCICIRLRLPVFLQSRPYCYVPLCGEVWCIPVVTIASLSSSLLPRTLVSRCCRHHRYRTLSLLIRSRSSSSRCHRVPIVLSFSNVTGTSDNDDHRSLETGIGYKYFKEFGCANPASIDPVCDTAKKGATCAMVCGRSHALQMIAVH